MKQEHTSNNIPKISDNQLVELALIDYGYAAELIAKNGSESLIPDLLSVAKYNKNIQNSIGLTIRSELGKKFDEIIADPNTQKKLRGITS